MPNRVEGIGSLLSKLMIIGEAPGTKESESGIPFVGPTGGMLDDALKEAGMNRGECYITNVCKYQPPFNDLKKLDLIGIDLEQQIEELWANEIRALKPNCILAIGDLALRAVTGLSGILNYRGSILRSRDGDIKVVPTIHPAALFNRGDKGGLDYNYWKLIKADIKRAVEESITPDFNLPERHLVVAKSSLDVYRFFREYDKLDRAAMDIESINCVPVCVGFAFNKFHALSIPLLKNIGKVELTPMQYSELIECWRIIDEQLRRLKLVGHNLKYDEFKLSLIGFECPNVISDTLIKTRIIFPELPDKRLSTVSSLWTREPYYKDEGKEFKFGRQRIDDFFLYNAKDCAVEIEVDEEQEKDLISMSETFGVPLVDYYYKYQMRKHKFYLHMENNGFRVDLERQKELKHKYVNLITVGQNKLDELVGHPVNVASYPQVFTLLYREMRFREMKLNPTSEDTIVALLSNHAKKSEHKEILETLLEVRRTRNQLSRYISFCPDYDGRCKSSFNIIATETCRSSTSILDKPVRPKKIGLAFHTISKHGRLAKDIRSMFIPDKGYVLVQVDAGQAEARVVAVLAEDYALLKAFDTVDIHRRTAGLIFGYTKTLILTEGLVKIVDELEKDGPERFTGKMVRHAGNYDMKKRRFMTEFNTNAQKFEINASISEWKAGTILDLFHGATPNIRGVFHRDIRDCLDSTRTLIDPFGGVRVFNGRFDEDLYKEGFANIPQRTVGHLVQGAALKIEDELNGDLPKDYMWISENHDSLLMQAPENNWEPYARLMKKHMMAPIDFSIYCSLKRKYILIIPCDVEISDTNYGEMRKVKL